MSTASEADLVAIPVRHYGRWIGAVVVIALLGLLAYAFSQGQIDYSITRQFLTEPTILRGMWNTLLISVLAQLIGIALGILAAVMRKSANPVTSGVAGLYIWFFRGTPVLLQLLIWYNLSLVFPTISIPGIWSSPTNDVMTPFLAALLGLGINEGAYMAEIVRAGINSVDEGQTEAAHALGLSPAKTMRRIVLPQAMRVIVPTFGNETISMLKTTSLIAAIGGLEMFGRLQQIYAQTFQIIPLLVVACLWYLFLTSVLTVAQGYLEAYFGRGFGEKEAEAAERRAAKRAARGQHV